MEIKLSLSEIVVQILGFLLVFWILRSLLWERVSRIVGERRQSIENSMKELEDKKKSLEDMERDYEKRLEGIHQEARHEIQKAVNEGRRIAHEIQEKARADALKQLDRAKSDIDLEVKKARSVLRKDIVELSTEMAQRAIQRHISVEDDEALVDEVLKEVKG